MSPKGSPKGEFSSKRTQTNFTETSIERIFDQSSVMSASLLSSIEKLRGRENYSTWKFSMENYLALEDLNCCLTETDASKVDTKKDVKAKSALILSIDKSNYVHVATSKTSKEVWDNLQRTFEDKGAVRKVTLVRKIVNTKLADCNSMQVYVTEIISTAQRLNDIGFVVGDEWLGIFLLAGLSDDYLPMIMAMEGGERALSSDSVKTKLLQETSSSSSHEKAFFAKSRKQNYRKNNNIICYSCRAKGHKSVSCPQKSKDDKAVAKKKSESSNLAVFSAVFLSGKYDKDDIFIDSGATKCMTMHRDWLTGTKDFDVPHIRAANNQLMKVDCIGAMNFSVKTEGICKEFRVKEVLCVPDLTANLLSVSQITLMGNRVIFHSRGCEIRNAKDELLATASCVDGLFKLDGFRSSSIERALAVASSNESKELWHRRLGHLNEADLERMRKGGVDGISYADTRGSLACVACCRGKQARKPFKRSSSKTKQLLELVHGDLAGKMETASIGGSRYALVLVDDFSRRTFTYLLKYKSETLERFCEFKALVENETGNKIKRFRSDNGTEFCSNWFKRLFKKHGIQHQKTVPYTPQQNGKVERTIRTIVERARCMLQDANLPKHFWGEAVNTATYIKNRTTSVVLNNKSPMEIWTGIKPNVSHFRVFGSKAMMLIPKEKRLKFDAKSKEYIFVGYLETQKGYRLIDEETGTIIAAGMSK